MKWVKGAKEGIVVAGGQGQGKELTQLSRPLGVRVDAAGTVYVADCGNDRVMRWSRGATQGTVVVGGNGWGEGANQFNCPTGLSFDRQGNLYVADLQQSSSATLFDREELNKEHRSRSSDRRYHWLLARATRKPLFCWWSWRAVTPCTDRASPLATRG